MNKQELTALIGEILQNMGQEPMVKGSDYKPLNPGPEQKDSHYTDGDFVEDVTKLNLRKLYLVDEPADEAAFRRLKEKTPARLGSGRAGARYKTLTMLRFRADHAAAQDAVFSQVPEDFAEKNSMVSVQTRCADKDQYLTRPDLGRCFDEENRQKIRASISGTPRVQIVVGDGLSSAAIQTNAMDCMAAIRDGLKLRNIDTGKAIFVRYCRVGAGDAVGDGLSSAACVANAMDCFAAIRDGLKLKGIDLGKTLFVRYCRVGAGDAVGDITGCKVVCMLVGERPGLVTDKSMSAYITYKPHTGVSESSRTVVSNIHAEGTPAVEAGAYITELIDTILKKKVSGVGLHLEGQG